ncbi:hypothetical protein BDZ91DRAFT_711470 [Kalaharituber pfeilii]|nr:hypothetical protein BDZ91DRAFT_711470 [Kalaharituber pfeilii]
MLPTLFPAHSFAPPIPNITNITFLPPYPPSSSATLTFIIHKFNTHHTAILPYYYAATLL